MEKIKKQVIAIDAVLIVGTLLALFFLIGYARPLVIAPIDNLETSNGSVLFSFEKAGMICLDDNPDFSSPQKIYAEDNLVINLKPGVYYWKVEGVMRSETRSLTINSEIDLMLRDNNGDYEVVNAGNSRLNVDIYSNSTLVGKVVLDVDESVNSSGNKFVGEENE